MDCFFDIMCEVTYVKEKEKTNTSTNKINAQFILPDMETITSENPQWMALWEMKIWIFLFPETSL